MWQTYISIRSLSRNIEPVRSIGLLCCWPQWATNHNIATGCKHSPRRAAACTDPAESFYLFLLFIYFWAQSVDSAELTSCVSPLQGEPSSSSSSSLVTESGRRRLAHAFNCLRGSQLLDLSASSFFSSISKTVLRISFSFFATLRKRRVLLRCRQTAGGDSRGEMDGVEAFIKTLVWQMRVPPSPKPLFVITQPRTCQTSHLSSPLILSAGVATKCVAHSGAVRCTGAGNGELEILPWFNCQRKWDGCLYVRACVRSPVEVYWYNPFFSVSSFSSSLVGSLTMGTADDVGSSTNVRK